MFNVQCLIKYTINTDIFQGPNSSYDMIFLKKQTIFCGIVTCAKTVDLNCLLKAFEKVILILFIKYLMFLHQYKAMTTVQFHTKFITLIQKFISSLNLQNILQLWSLASNCVI